MRQRPDQQSRVIDRSPPNAMVAEWSRGSRVPAWEALWDRILGDVLPALGQASYDVTPDASLAPTASDRVEHGGVMDADEPSASL